MAEYVFRRYVNDTMESYRIYPLPAPVRVEKEEEIFGGNEVRLDLLLHEIELFRSEYPDLRDIYAGTMEIFAWLEGMRAGTEGDAKKAARYLEMGLETRPASLLLRSNYALVLQLQGRSKEALEQYEMVLADPEGGKNPVVRLLAARFFAEQGMYLEAYRLLDKMACSLPADDSFWDFLAEIKALAGVRNGDALVAGAEASVTTITCPACGYALKPGQRFCGACGKDVAGAIPQGPACASCGNPLEVGLRFCNRCGKPVQGARPARAYCASCGNPLEEGLRFCNRCGKPV